MKQVFHLVLLKFKPAGAGQVDRLFAALDGLRKIPGMLSFKAGRNNSPEGLSQGFTHGFVMTFKDAAARDVYLAHPDHEKVKAEFLPLVENVLVFDFEA